MASAKEMFEQIMLIFKDLSLMQKIVAAVVVGSVIGGLMMLTTGQGTSSYSVLFSSMSESDAAEVVAKLKEIRVPYEITMNGTAVKVPSEKVLDTRLSLAGEGLPRGGGVGFELGCFFAIFENCEHDTRRRMNRNR